MGTIGTISLIIPQIGQPDTTEDVKLQNALTTIQTVINGNIDSTNVAASLAQSASVNQSGQTVKGSSIIATQQSTGSTTFTTLATPDQVTGIVLPSAGLIQVWYQARWFESVSGAASAEIFLGANAVKTAQISGGPAAVSANIGGTAGIATVLHSFVYGLVGAVPGTGYTGEIATGQVIGDLNTNTGGPCTIFAAAGTYTVSVQFKASSGTVTADGRRLYVEALSFA